MSTRPSQRVVRQCRYCLYPITRTSDARGPYWVHTDTNLTRCPEAGRRRQVADPADHPITKADVALSGGPSCR